MKKSYTSLTFIVILIFVFGCSEPVKNEKLTIVTTTGIIADCIENIVGDQAQVISLMGAGVDPHLYKASQGDITKLSRADIIVYNGLHLEGKMAQMLKNYSKTKPTYAVGDFVPDSLLKQVDETSDLVDPHIWFNPAVWLIGLGGVVGELKNNQSLTGLDSNFNHYLTLVSKTTKNLNQLLDSTLSVEKRILITSHDAFSYFGDAFKFRVRGLQGISTAAEFGVKDVKNLIDFVIENDIKSVFVETSVSDKNLMAVLEGAKARGHNLKIGGTLYSDALGEENTEAGTYIGMLKSNVNTVGIGLSK